MTNLMEFITEKVVGRVAISYPPKYVALDIETEVENIPVRAMDALRYRLSISWNQIVVCVNSIDKEHAKERLIESFKHAIYEDIIADFYSLRTAVYNHDFAAAIKILNRMEDKIIH